MFTFCVIVGTGAGGKTVTVTSDVLVHPPTVPVTVYVVVDAGNALTFDPVVALSPVAGAQVYVFAPLATRFAVSPGQIPGLEGVIVTTGFVITVTVTVVVRVHPLDPVPVMVYVVVDGGLDVTVAPVVALSPVAGLHV